MVVPDGDPVITGLVRRAEAFLRDLFDQDANTQPLLKLKDLERYLRSLPRQGSYFAEAVRATVEPPEFMPSVQVHTIGRRMNINDISVDADAQEAEDDREWRQEWREKAAPAVAEFWKLVAEAVRANQKA